jgi:hypothetical protein
MGILAHPGFVTRPGIIFDDGMSSYFTISGKSFYLNYQVNFRVRKTF